MKLANFSVNRPVAVIMVVLALMMIGAVSLSGLHVDLLPEMELPVAVVITGYTGSAPQEVENMVTRPLEEAWALLVISAASAPCLLWAIRSLSPSLKWERIWSLPLWRCGKR
jgi:Cu/Ag efflux pump CusA